MTRRNPKLDLRRLACVAIATLSLLLSAGVSSALACTPPRGNDYPIGYWDGWTRSSNSVVYDTVKANIDSQTPYVYQVSGANGEQNGSYAWLMLTSSSGDAFAQYGPYVANGGVRYNFLFCAHSGSSPGWTFESPSTPGTNPLYRITNTSDGHKQFFIDGVWQDNCPVSTTFDPGGAEFAGEIHTAADQIPGKVSNHDFFRNATLIHHNGDVEAALSQGHSDIFSYDSTGRRPGTPSFPKQSVTDAYTMSVWDNACP
jgi:hypothetical protein